MDSFVSEEINRYCEAHSTLPSSITDRLAAYTVTHIKKSHMLSGPLVGSFLGFLVATFSAKRILEIGTYTGYSALCMAERLCSEGTITTLDVDQAVVDVAKQFWLESEHGNKITSIVGPALDSLKTLAPEFDLVFIDADKCNYMNYLSAVLPLLSEKGIVLADNCLWSGKVLEQDPSELETKALQEFNQYVHSNPKLETTLLPLRDGLHMIRQRQS